jgi:hypothetical protein
MLPKPISKLPQISTAANKLKGLFAGRVLVPVGIAQMDEAIALEASIGSLPPIVKPIIAEPAIANPAASPAANPAPVKVN